MGQKYEVLKITREREYCDEWETVVSVDLRREDGVEGNVWLVAGVPPCDRGSSRAAGHQEGFVSCRIPDFGSWDAWCSFDRPNEDSDYTPEEMISDIIEACYRKTIHEHRVAQNEVTDEVSE